MISVSDAADIFSAIGTVGAFGVVMYLLRKEQQREATRSEDERRAQAARVSAWLETSPTSHGGRELLFHVHNASDMPIYEVSLPTMTPGEEDAEAEFIGRVPPGQTIMRPAARGWIKTYFTRPSRCRSSSWTVADDSGNVMNRALLRSKIGRQGARSLRNLPVEYLDFHP